MNVCITSCRSLGCTFLDWSIHFLSGQTDFYHVNSKQWIPLSVDPITEINAHGHKKNHPKGSAGNFKFLSHVQNFDDNRLYSVYPVMTFIDVAAKELGYNTDQIGDPDTYAAITRYILKDYLQIFNDHYDAGSKIVFVSLNPTISSGYLTTVRALNKSLFHDDQVESVDQAIDEIQQVFFSKSISIWESQQLTNKWDVRERMALDARFFDPVIEPKLAMPHLWIDSQELWFNGEAVLRSTLDYLGLPIIDTRLSQWLPIYYKWQAIQAKALKFAYTYKHIVDSIINNVYYEIDLSFQQEVAIQHCLIYQHGLNLKTWQLEKFPNNTQDLHKLLEPNIHPL